MTRQLSSCCCRVVAVARCARLLLQLQFVATLCGVAKWQTVAAMQLRICFHSLSFFFALFSFFFLLVWQLLLSQESQQINQATCAIKVDALGRIRTVANDDGRVWERRDKKLVIQQGLKYMV